MERIITAGLYCGLVGGVLAVLNAVRLKAAQIAKWTVVATMGTGILLLCSAQLFLAEWQILRAVVSFCGAALMLIGVYNVQRSKPQIHV